MRRASVVWVLVASWLWLGATGCDDVRRHGGRGIVEDVRPEMGQVVVSHDEIRGVMMAMTMNFDVPDPQVLAKLRPGQEISFTMVATGSSYEIIDVRVLGEVDTDGEWARLGEKLVRTTEAPDFDLVDQNGERRTLADYAGRVVLLDFIFTRCEGPCPIMTAREAGIQRKLDPSLRERVAFVSISLDPVHDTPEALRAYAALHGADLSNWSFLTPPRADLERGDAVVRAYAVGKTRNEEGTIEHLVAAFLVGPRGRILKRYLGMQHESDAMLRDLESAAAALPEAGRGGAPAGASERDAS